MLISSVLLNIIIGYICLCMIQISSKICPCGLSQSYENCCSKVHQSIYNAKTAEQLMRSRYTAFTLADGDYLMKSHHQSTRPLSEKKAIVKWAKSVEWVRLEVLKTTEGENGNNKGTVEFKAYFKDRKGLQFIHENSMFIKENKVWYYVDAL